MATELLGYQKYWRYADHVHAQTFAPTCRVSANVMKKRSVVVIPATSRKSRYASLFEDLPGVGMVFLGLMIQEHQSQFVPTRGYVGLLFRHDLSLDSGC